jgi:hypothetical protein
MQFARIGKLAPRPTSGSLAGKNFHGFGPNLTRATKPKAQRKDQAVSTTSRKNAKRTPSPSLRSGSARFRKAQNGAAAFPRSLPDGQCPLKQRRQISEAECTRENDQTLCPSGRSFSKLEMNQKSESILRETRLILPRFSPPHPLPRSCAPQPINPWREHFRNIPW